MPIVEETLLEATSHYYAADYLSQRSPGLHVKQIIDDFLTYHKLWPRARGTDDGFADGLDEFAVLGFAWERMVINDIVAGRMPRLADTPRSVIRRIYEHGLGAVLNEVELQQRPEMIRPGEITVDGIHGTADGCNVVSREGEEWKCSWASAKSTDSLAALDACHPDWMMQMPAYCYMWGWDSYVLRILHVNGYYEKRQIGVPVRRQLRLRWDEQEKEENWRLLIEHREVMREEGRG